MAEFQLTFQSIFSVVGVYTHYSYLLHHANAKRPHGTCISCALMTQKAESWAYESDPQLTFFPKGHTVTFHNLHPIPVYSLACPDRCIWLSVWLDGM